MVWWYVGFIKILAPIASWRVAAATAVAAALEALEARAAAREAAAGTPNNAPSHSKDDQAGGDNEANDGPLAISDLHAVVPTREGCLHIVDLVPKISPLHDRSYTPRQQIQKARPQTPPHGHVDRRHLGRERPITNRARPGNGITACIKQANVEIGASERLLQRVHCAWAKSVDRDRLDAGMDAVRAASLASLSARQTR